MVDETSEQVRLKDLVALPMVDSARHSFMEF